MKENSSFPKCVIRRITVLTFLFLIPLFSTIPGTSVQAAEERSAVDNLTYTFTTTNDSAISTAANPNETTVLIFGHIGCSKTRSTLNSISSCDWVKRSDIRVIFVDINGNTKENVQTTEAGYNCPDITFCYDEDFVNVNDALYYYKQHLNVTDSTIPVILLIDKNNKIQNYMTGTKTSDEILAEINKFAEIGEGDGNTQPPSDTGIENFAYGLTTIDNTSVSTKANPNETTVLIFGYTTCGNTKATLQDIDQSNWVSRSDIRVIYADVYGTSLTETAEFAENYSSKKIIFCHDSSNLNWNHALSYLRLINETGGTFPYIILIDKNNKIQSITMGPKTADEILAEINKFVEDSNSSTTDTPNPDPTDTPDSEESSQPPSVSDVSNLKSTSAAKSIKLTWKKVPQASGYIIYQYSSSKKTWVMKKTLETNTDSYTVKGLTPGTSYRFAVKAYIKSNGTQVYSKSYTSLYTATNPNSASFKVTAGKGKATIKWNKVKGATNYTVYYKTSAKGSWKILKKTKSTSYTKTNLTSRKTYIFTVKANKVYKGKTYTSSYSSKKVKIK